MSEFKWCDLEITGAILVTKHHLDDKRVTYTAEHRSGDVIGISQFVFDDVDKNLLRPVENRCYVLLEYHLEYLGLSSRYDKTVIFRVRRINV